VDNSNCHRGDFCSGRNRLVCSSDTNQTECLHASKAPTDSCCYSDASGLVLDKGCNAPGEPLPSPGPTPTPTPTPNPDCVPTHNKEKGPRCSDGLDNDCDQAIDGADSDCQ